MKVIIYISSACCISQKEIIEKKAIKNLIWPVIKFHNLIIDGIAENENVKVYSVIGLPVSIKTNKKVFWKRNLVKNKNKEYIQTGFINLPFLKQYTQGIGIYKIIKNILKNNKSNEIEIIYDASFVSIMHKLFKIINKFKIKSVGIFADIYDYMFEVQKKSSKNKILKIIVRKQANKVYNESYGYIFLTKQMNELINKHNKPYLIMEGIVDNEKVNDFNAYKKDNFILYAGGLHEKYGIKNLVDGFDKIIDDNLELHLYGDGDLVNYIKKYKNKRIKFYGLVDNNEILIQEKKAVLLVNPRFSNGEYTKYSFPSKIMEYMLSGTPVLTTKLPGIPDDYDKYLFYINDESIDGLYTAINETLELGEKYLKERGKKAKEYVINYKNKKIQGKRIIDL